MAFLDNVISAKIAKFKYLRVSLFVALSLIVGLGLVHLLSKMMLPTGDYAVRHIWLAGVLWTTGASPYSNSFAQLSSETFTTGYIPNYWLYPPNWYLIAAPLGLLPYKTAVLAWKFANLAMLVVSAWVLALATRPKSDDVPRLSLTFLLILAFCLFTQSSVLVITAGQTAIAAFLGLSLALYGFQKKSDFALLLGLVLVALKPQIGGFVLAFFVAYSPTRKIAVVSCMASLALCVPAFLADGIYSSLIGWLNNTREFEAIKSNNLGALTGLRNLAYLGFGFDIKSMNFLIFGSVFSFLLGLFYRKIDWPEPEKIIAFAFLVSIVQFISPLHYYDGIIAAVIFAAALTMKGSKRFLLLACLLIMVRADHLARIAGVEPDDALYLGITVSSLFSALIFGGIVFAVVFAIAKTTQTKADY